LDCGLFQRKPIAAHPGWPKSDRYPDRLRKPTIPGVVRSVEWGVYVQDGSGNTSTGLLPSVSPTIDWVRLPQRFPVRIQVLGSSPVPLRIGQTVSVAMTSEVEPPETSKLPALAQP
jgi:multidrug resistance efflux pump